MLYRQRFFIMLLIPIYTGGAWLHELKHCKKAGELDPQTKGYPADLLHLTLEHGSVFSHQPRLSPLSEAKIVRATAEVARLFSEPITLTFDRFEAIGQKVPRLALTLAGKRSNGLGRLARCATEALAKRHLYPGHMSEQKNWRPHVALAHLNPEVYENGNEIRLTSFALPSCCKANEVAYSFSIKGMVPTTALARKRIREGI
jgi:2'-5' RNA ligase